MFREVFQVKGDNDLGRTTYRGRKEATFLFSKQIEDSGLVQITHPQNAGSGQSSEEVKCDQGAIAEDNNSPGGSVLSAKCGAGGWGVEAEELGGCGWPPEEKGPGWAVADGPGFGKHLTSAP